jgi:hypothetical protein
VPDPHGAFRLRGQAGEDESSKNRDTKSIEMDDVESPRASEAHQTPRASTTQMVNNQSLLPQRAAHRSHFARKDDLHVKPIPVQPREHREAHQFGAARSVERHHLEDTRLRHLRPRTNSKAALKASN